MPGLTDRSGQPTSGQFQGLVEALVTDNEDPQKLGRVKLKFPGLPDAPESAWARVSTPMAGKKRGWVSIPEVGDEVLVAFSHGDVNHAVVVGSVYNGVDVPPYTNDDGKNNLRVFQSRSGHRVTFDDTDGSERIELVTSNEEVKVIWDSKEKTLSLYAGKDIIVEAKEKIELKCKDFALDASGSVSVKAGSTLELEGSSGGTIKSDGTLTLKGSAVQIN
jgi:phage baseplate assembly protein V